MKAKPEMNIDTNKLTEKEKQLLKKVMTLMKIMTWKMNSLMMMMTWNLMIQL